jgi:hypothetical protein
VLITFFLFIFWPWYPITFRPIAIAFFFFAKSQLLLKGFVVVGTIKLHQSGLTNNTINPALRKNILMSNTMRFLGAGISTQGMIYPTVGGGPNDGCSNESSQPLASLER